MSISVKEIAKFGMLGAVMYGQKVVLASLPNIHLCAVLIIVLTVIYRAKALYPIYVYVLLEGLFGGFTAFWIPYLYVWALLWAAVMFLPGDLPEKKYGRIVYMITGGLHGLLFGVLCTPGVAPFFHFGLKGMISWVASGITYDVIHGVSNFILCSLTVPLIRVFKKLERIN